VRRFGQGVECQVFQPAGQQTLVDKADAPIQPFDGTDTVIGDGRCNSFGRGHGSNVYERIRIRSYHKHHSPASAKSITLAAGFAITPHTHENRCQSDVRPRKKCRGRKGAEIAEDAIRWLL
jgi:hypothetical protein